MGNMDEVRVLGFCFALTGARFWSSFKTLCLYRPASCRGEAFGQ